MSVLHAGAMRYDMTTPAKASLAMCPSTRMPLKSASTVQRLTVDRRRTGQTAQLSLSSAEAEDSGGAAALLEVASHGLRRRRPRRLGQAEPPFLHRGSSWRELQLP
jgi:hypothetical protein